MKRRGSLLRVHDVATGYAKSLPLVEDIIW